VRGAQLTGRGDVYLAGDLSRATEIARAVLARLVRTWAGLYSRRQFEPVEKVSWRE
jgi:hypothetical protein